jgi:hypothetical protein
VLWHTPNAEQGHAEFADRCTLLIETGNASLHTHPSLGECRALAAHLLAMADAIEADTTVFQPPKGD